MIANAALIRNRSDHEDFYVCSVQDTLKLLEGAESFHAEVAGYLKKRYDEMIVE